MRGRLRGAAAGARGVLQARRRVPGLRVHPRTSVRVAASARLEVAGTLNLGLAWPGTPHRTTHALFGPGSLTVVAGGLDVYTGSSLEVGEGAELRAGDRTYLNSGCLVLCRGSITLGEGCYLAEQVVLRDDDDHRVDGRPSRAPISIGDRVWIGMRATVLKGVRIGDGAVVAAGAVVTRDVPERALVAGVPARVVRTDVSWGD